MPPGTDVVAQQNFLIPNATFFVELAIFMIVLGVIWFFVVPPIRKVLEEREKRVNETAVTAKEASEIFAEAEARYNKALEKARAEAAEIRNQARAEGRAILDELRGEAQQEADQIVAETTAHLRADADQVAAELRESVEPLAHDLADRMLGKNGRTRTSAGHQRGQGSS
ncbi:F0F1 ATP synthase subunit B [Nocardia huaxiensis]|uniref:ATP synthase subunit b n=1 Tax=Nocardia huaxiensis TaxID=2755382 RepID=A0A7D6ZJV8_9NOCA|nr:F0F1 ATP synthase subunit B [Nocardia huaxiensis]QLY29423.1 F0F1 ATP synthase subunit B [Nocardia huaxiensis]UFS97029.1 F0F1 ATP synthase subunit B [Nocardia huaxiensis]